MVDIALLRGKYQLLKKLFPDNPTYFEETEVASLIQQATKTGWWRGFWVGYVIAMALALTAHLAPNMWS